MANDGEHVVLVGCGYVGEVAAAGLAATGRRVTGIRRTAPEAATPPGLDMLAMDVLDPANASALPDDADVLVFALSPGGGTPENYRRVHLDAVSIVVGRQRRPPRLVLLTTSTAVYGQDGGDWVDEDSPTIPMSETAKVLVEAEAALATLGVPAASLRLGGIYGPGRERLVRQVIAGEASCVEGHFSNRIHRDDAAGAIVHLVTSDGPVPTVCNVVDDTPALQSDVLAWLAARLDAPAPTILPAGSGTGRQATSKRVRNTVLRSTGWEPAHPSWREGYAALLEDR